MVQFESRFPDLDFMTIPGREVWFAIGFTSCRDVGLQTVALLKIDPQNKPVVLFFADTFDEIVDDVRIYSRDRSFEVISLITLQVGSHGRRRQCQEASDRESTHHRRVSGQADEVR